MRRIPEYWSILAAIALAVLVGATASADTHLGPIGLVDLLDFIGTLFLRALKMIVVPLVVASIVVGVGSTGETRAFGRMAAKTVLYYVTTSLSAIVIGLLLVDLIAPGVIGGVPARQVLGLHASTEAVTASVHTTRTQGIGSLLLRLIPENVLADAVHGKLLGLISFSLLFGYFMSRLTGPAAAALSGFWQGLLDVMLAMTSLVMRVAPAGVFALVAKVVLTTGFGMLKPLVAFFVCVVLGLLVHAGAVLPSLLLLVGRVSPRQHVRAMSPALLMAFSTASSSATLPVTLECVERRAGVSQRVAGFTLPLGATVNMDGTALYECVAALFIAQAYGVHLGFWDQFLVVLLALLTSIGVAGIPAASLVAITIILGAVGVPLEGLGLILAVDRILDMLRTAVNVFSDSCGAVIIARTEGETPRFSAPEGS